MANQRPIRRRPWRRPPWRGTKRPKRWNASINYYIIDGDDSRARLGPIIIPEGILPALPVATLVSGQVDVEPWADEQEVTLDRLVGSIELRALQQWTASEVIEPPMPYVKMGILVNEEINETVDGTQIAIFEQERLEDYEWMWLWGGYMDHVLTRRIDEAEPEYASTFRSRIELDLHNRRKIGQGDELNLYAQVLSDTTLVIAPLAQLIVDVRTILMSK